MAFDYSRLSWSDFELLSADIIEWNVWVSLEIFSNWKDDGVDARYSKSKSSNDIIVQSKHYADWKSLHRILKDELLKVQILNPNRYILVVSTPLTKTQVDTVFKLFSPYIQSTADIYHRDRLDLILSKDENLLRRHMKLWLDSGIILKHIIKSWSIQKSEQVRDDIEKKIRVYVRNTNLDSVLEIFTKSHYCIISGAPGIWKSTLAEMTIYFFIKEGYELVKLDSKMSEWFDLLGPDYQKQIFYFDDFLWSNFLEDGIGEKNEDDSIIRFINRIWSMKNKKLILTTREYILNQAFQKYNKFIENSIDIRKFTVGIAQYSLVDKARILYNHLFFSDISFNIKQEISEKGLYKNLIGNDFLNFKHWIFSNRFNPKIIDIFLKTESISLNSAKSWWELLNRIVDTLKNPKILYDNVFQYQITESSRQVLYSLFGFWWNEEYSNVQDMWVRLRKFEGFTATERDFQISIKELEWTFIKTYKLTYKSERIYTYIDFSDPFVKDFLSDRIFRERMTLFSILSNVVRWQQIMFLHTWFMQSEDIKNGSTWWFFGENEVLRIIEQKVDSIIWGPSVGERLLWIYKNITQLRAFVLHWALSLVDPKDWAISILLAMKFDNSIEFDHLWFIEQCLDEFQWILDSKYNPDEIADYFEKFSGELLFDEVSEYFERYWMPAGKLRSLVEATLSKYDSIIWEVEYELNHGRWKDAYWTDYLDDVTRYSSFLGDFISDNSTSSFASEISEKLEELHQSTDDDDSWKDHRSSSTNSGTSIDPMSQVDEIFWAGFR